MNSVWQWIQSQGWLGLSHGLWIVLLLMSGVEALLGKYGNERCRSIAAALGNILAFILVPVFSRVPGVGPLILALLRAIGVLPEEKREHQPLPLACLVIPLLIPTLNCTWFKTTSETVGRITYNCAKDAIQGDIDEARTVLTPILSDDTGQAALAYAGSHDLGNKAIWRDAVEDYAKRRGWEVAMCALRRIVLYGISSVGAESGPEAKSAQVKAQLFIDEQRATFEPASSY